MYIMTVYNTTENYHHLNSVPISSLGSIERYLGFETMLNAEERADFKQQLASEGIAEVKTWHRYRAFTELEITVMIDSNVPVYT